MALSMENKKRRKRKENKRKERRGEATERKSGLPCFVEHRRGFSVLWAAIYVSRVSDFVNAAVLSEVEKFHG